MDFNNSAKMVLEFVGGSSNVASFTSCMTRLRVTVVDVSKVDFDALKTVEGALGVNPNGNEVQVIFGPANVGKAKNAFGKVLDKNATANPKTIEELAAEQKNKVKGNQNASVKEFFSKFSNIFVPLIPGFIGAGMLSGFSTLIETLVAPGDATLEAGRVLADTLVVMSMFNTILMAYLYIMVAYNASKAFGGSGVIGAIIGGMFVVDPTSFTNANIVTSPEGVESVTIFGFAYITKGGMIGALIASYVSAKVEILLEKVIPSIIDMMVRPLLALLISGLFTLIVIMPAAGVLFQGMSFLFETLNSSMLGNGVLAGTFLGAVLLGIHQGFVPVYEGLLDSTGMNTLFPVLAMAGAGQVGAALALYSKAPKNSNLRNIIRGALVPGFLGVGEPLIYGVTLPRVKPFFTAGLGGMVGGLYIGFFVQFLDMPFGLNTVFGPSGLVALPLMTGGTGENAISVFAAMGIYLSALIVAYVAGYLFTMFFGVKGVDLN